MQRVLRAVIAVGVCAVAGCVSAPPPPPAAPGQVYLSQHCVAGFYQCNLAEAGPLGSPCACPGLGAPSYGTIR